MLNIAAREAGANFGELMDTAQREPISIEKHGRPVAALMSAIEHERLKLDLLQTKVSVGFKQLDQGKQSALSVLEIMKKPKRCIKKYKLSLQAEQDLLEIFLSGI